MLVGKIQQTIRPKFKDKGEVSQKQVPLVQSPNSENMSSISGLNKSPLKTNSKELAFKGSFFSLYKEVSKADINKFLNSMDEPLDGMVRHLYDAVIKSNLVKTEGNNVIVSKKTIPTLIGNGFSDPFLKFPGDILNGIVEGLGHIKPLEAWAEKTLEKPLFKKIRQRSKIDYEVNAFQGLIDFRKMTLKDALKNEAQKLGVKVEELTDDVKLKVEQDVDKNMQWYIFQRSMKPFDSKVGNYDTKHERALNRLVTGLPPAIFLANDAYNLSRMMDDNPNEAKKEKRIRFRQETSRILMSGYLTLITMGALNKLINNSKIGIMAMTGTTVLFTEMYSRLRNGKYITRLTPEQARQINEKNHAPEAEIKPEKLSFKSNSDNKNSSKEKTQKPLLSFDTLLKASIASVAIGFSIKGLRKIPRIDAAFDSVFKPFKNLYKNLSEISDYKVSQKQIDEVADALIEQGYQTRGSQYRQVAIRSRELVVEKVINELNKTSDIKAIDRFIETLNKTDVHSDVIKKNFNSLLGVLDKNNYQELVSKYQYKTVSGIKKDNELKTELLKIKTELQKSGKENADLVDKITKNGLNKIIDNDFYSQIKTALEGAGDKNGKLFKNYSDAVEGFVNFGVRDKKVKPLVNFVITPFSFMWSIVKFPYKIANGVVELFMKKAPKSSKSIDELNMEAVSKSFDKIYEQVGKYRKALASTTDPSVREKYCKKFRDFVMDNTLKAFNVNTMSNLSNSDLSNLAKTAATAATIWFLMTDNYNMVMLKSNGNDVEGAETKFKERFVQEGSRLFYQTLLIDLFNKTFQKQYNSSLLGMSWISLTNTTIGEWLTRKSVGVPIGMHTREELLKFEEEQNNATGFKKEYYQFMKRLTGKRSIQSYNVKKDNREDVPVQTSSSLPQKSDLNFTNSKTFGNMIKG